MDSINPNFKRLQQRKAVLAEKLLPQLLAGKRSALSQGLTLVESKLPAHRKEAEKLVKLAMPHSGGAMRIGITGVPGVGKSTFIEALGEYLTSRGKKLAVLAIDPSSARSRGSILGDKTRMEKLSQNDHAFIRPSPTAGSLGGVARKTRESILLCEAAGYDVVLVETVGVGQSETAVKYMVDFFMLLMLAGAGDELQGIKRGIMEMADMLIINKADDIDPKKIKMAMGEYKRALHLFPPNTNEWIPEVLSASALKSKGIDEAWAMIEKFENQQKLKGYFHENRKQQALSWLDEAIGELLIDQFYQNTERKAAYLKMKEAVQQGEIEPGIAAQKLISKH